ncbi:hypothetical protein ACFQX7_09280 [Luedemannella flava]
MGDPVMVFAPAPLLTVTIEQRADAVDLHVHPGGQGVWQARMIAALGGSVVLCAAMGGETGNVLGNSSPRRTSPCGPCRATAPTAGTCTTGATAPARWWPSTRATR